MMFNLKGVPFALSVLLLQVLPSLASVAQPLIARAEGKAVIEALLRRPQRAPNGALVQRQSGTCDIGYSPCTDGSGGCCAIGQYCGTFGGVPGCCPIGHNCSPNSSVCDKPGYLECSGETFCCPAGDFCGRDANGSPRCYSSPNHTVTVGTTKVPTPTKTTPKVTPTITVETNTFSFETSFNTFTDVSTDDIFGLTDSESGTAVNLPTRTTTKPIVQSTFAGGATQLPAQVGSNGATTNAGTASVFLLVVGLIINVVAH